MVDFGTKYENYKWNAIVVLCPRYYSKRWKARPTDKENQDYVR